MFDKGQPEGVSPSFYTMWAPGIQTQYLLPAWLQTPLPILLSYLASILFPILTVIDQLMAAISLDGSGGALTNERGTVSQDTQKLPAKCPPRSLASLKFGGQHIAP